MKLEILDQPYAEAEIDLYAFKEEFKKNLDLDNSIQKHTTITKNNCSEIKEPQLMLMVSTLIDWQSLIADALIVKNHTRIMKLRFFFVKYSDWKRLYPGHVTTDSKTFEFEEENTEGYGSIIIQSLVRNPSFDINGFIRAHQFMYCKADRLVKWVVR